ncbi:MAG: phage portal protein [Carnobacterium maltaromaticum]
MSDVKFLGKKRFDEEANKVYKVPVKKLPKRNMLDTQTGEIVEAIDFESEEMLNIIVEFIRHHREKQVPRLKELERYYQGDNNIKYRQDKPDQRADNRIASDFGKFIVAFKRGVLLGNPLKYNGDKTLMAKVDEFNSQTNEDYHNQMMGLDTFKLGRGYELVYRNEDAQERLAKLDAKNTFVIYESKVNPGSVAGVRYFNSDLLNEKRTCVEIYANDGFIYYFECDNDDLDNLGFEDKEPSYFEAVQINEWSNNEERTGDYESVMDNIDAYDSSQSEMANFQQEMSNALLVLEGNPETFRKKDGSFDKEAFDYSLRARFMVLGDKKNYGDGVSGSDPKAYYLKKEYDTAGVEAYNNRLVADILRFTFLVDFTDENMGSNQSGIGFRFKGWGSDNDRKNKERQLNKAIMRRLRLLTHSWSIKENLNKPTGLVETIRSIFSSEDKRQKDLYKKVNEIEILFTPNVPQSDEEIMNVIKGMVGIVSDETLFDMATRLTGVPVEEELKRVMKEQGKEITDPYKETEPKNTDLSIKDSEEDGEE